MEFMYKVFSFYLGLMYMRIALLDINIKFG